MKAPIFLDRDGTIIEEVHYLSDSAQMVLIPGAGEAIARANKAGHKVVIITNQSGVARGYFPESFAAEGGKHMEALLKGTGGHIDGYYYSPFHPKGNPPYNQDHPDRKPGPGMIEQAKKEMGLSLKGAFVVGDKNSDLETGLEQGMIPLLVRTGYGIETENTLSSDFFKRGGQVFDALPQAIDWILTR